MHSPFLTQLLKREHKEMYINGLKEAGRNCPNLSLSVLRVQADCACVNELVQSPRDALILGNICVTT